MVSIAKACSLVIVFVVSVVCGFVLPYLVLRFLRRKYDYSSGVFNTVLSILNCYSGGVFFSTSILALLPEAREQLGEAEVSLNNIDNYPSAELITGIGFLSILIVESVTIACHKKHKKDNNCYDVSLKEISNNANQGLPVSAASVSTTEQQDIEVYKQSDEIGKHELSENRGMEEMYGEGMTNLRNFIMLLALSIHMIFDGLELGLLQKENKVWSVLLALSIHKVLILFSMGVKIWESTTFAKFAMAMMFLSAVSPVGVGIGILMTSQNESLTVLRISAILQSFAVGTFIYVTFFDILLREFISAEGNRIFKTISTVSGFASFAVISYLMPE